MPLPSDNLMPSGPGRFILGTFGFAFGGIGLSFLVFLWGTPSGQMDSPPIFFRLFGSFIAIVFVAMGGTAFISAIKGRRTMEAPISSLEPIARPTAMTAPTPAPTPAIGYCCPGCGAPLSAHADVSPMGDVKCPFCHTWFNIHQKTA